MDSSSQKSETTSPQFAIDATGLTKRYGELLALNEVSVRVLQGEVFGIVGESGSGKSTLLRLLNLEETADSGSYRLNIEGVPTADLLTLDRMSRRDIQNRYLGIVYQHPHLGLRMHNTSSGNIASRLLIAGERRFEMLREAARTALTTSEFPLDRMDALPVELSGGMQQRVQLAKAIAMKPAVVLLDEPTSGLDVSVQARVLDTFRLLQQETHVTTILVSHDLGVIRALADRVIVMRHGAIVEAGLTDQILEDPQEPYTQQLVYAKL